MYFYFVVLRFDNKDVYHSTNKHSSAPIPDLDEGGLYENRERRLPKK